MSNLAEDSPWEAQLLPCAFCGGPGRFIDIYDGDVVPECMGDGCWATLGAFATEEEAVAAWNGRAREESVRKLVEAARAVLIGWDTNDANAARLVLQSALRHFPAPAAGEGGG